MSSLSCLQTAIPQLRDYCSSGIARLAFDAFLQSTLDNHAFSC